MLNGLTAVKKVIENVIEKIGQWISWCTLVMVVIMTAIVVLRYGFNLGWIAMQESVIYFHAFTFMLGIAYTFKVDEHVRVDIFYTNFSQQKKAWVNLCGDLLLLMPVCGVIFYFSFEYVIQSWAMLEGSAEAGGLSGVFILKSLLLVMPGLLLLQGIADVIRQVLVIISVASSHPAETKPAQINPEEIR